MLNRWIVSACGVLAIGVGCTERVVERPHPHREPVYVETAPPPPQVVYVEGAPPPPVPVEVIPVSPGPAYYWAGPRYERHGGYWVLRHGEYQVRR